MSNASTSTLAPARVTMRRATDYSLNPELYVFPWENADKLQIGDYVWDSILRIRFTVIAIEGRECGIWQH